MDKWQIYSVTQMIDDAERTLRRIERIIHQPSVRSKLKLGFYLDVMRAIKRERRRISRIEKYIEMRNKEIQKERGNGRVS